MSKRTYIYKHLIPDQDVTHLATTLLEHGYYAVASGGNSDGKSWCIPSSGVPMHTPSYDGTPPSITQVQEAFNEFPHCGLSIATPYLRPPYKNDLFVLDVDGDNDALMTTISNILPAPCPVRRGSKGAAFILRYPYMRAIPSLLLDRGLIVPPWVKDSILKITHLKFHIDLLGLKTAHVIIPPSIHSLASQQAGHEVRYQWIPFPGTTIVQDLFSVPPSELPEIQPYHLLLLYQYAKNPNSALFQYIGATDAGNHHMAMLAASTYMYHERFTPDEIIAICNQEAERSADSQNKIQERFKEIETAVSTLVKRIPDTRPSGQNVVAKNKVPRDRQVADYFIQQYGADNLAYFNNVAHYWTGKDWTPLVDLSHTNPWVMLYNEAWNLFPDLNHGLVKSAINSFSSLIPTRAAAPNHNYIPFKNGLLDVFSHEIRPIERDDFIVHPLEYPFDPNARCPMWEQFIRTLLYPPDEVWPDEPERRASDHELAIQVVEEFFGYCFVRSHDFQMMLHLIGAPGTGKSVLIKVLRELMPKSWSSTVSLDMFGDPNARMLMANSHVNLSAEVGRRSRDVDDIILRITSAEEVECKILFQNKTQLVLPSRLIFWGNLPPDTTDSTGAIQRRTLHIKTTDIRPTTIVWEYEKVLLKEATGILRRLTMAYQRLLERGRFDPPEYAVAAIEQTRQESNSAIAWMMECTAPSDETTVNSDLFAHYMDWCDQNHMFKYSVVQWGKHLTRAGVPIKKKRMPGNNYIQTRSLQLRSNMAGVKY